MEQHKVHSWEGRRGERELLEDPEQQSLSSVQSVTARPVLALLLHLTAQSLPRAAPCPAPALVPPPLPIHLSNPDSTSQGSIINQFLVRRGRQSILKAIFLTKLPISSAALGIGKNNPTAQTCYLVCFRHITKQLTITFPMSRLPEKDTSFPVLLPKLFLLHKFSKQTYSSLCI